jgi:hypothetical protein
MTSPQATAGSELVDVHSFIRSWLRGLDEDRDPATVWQDTLDRRGISVRVGGGAGALQEGVLVRCPGWVREVIGVSNKLHACTRPVTRSRSRG